MVINAYGSVDRRDCITSCEDWEGKGMARLTFTGDVDDLDQSVTDS